ncbi:response regulator transcription factor [Alkalihalobacillus trypoxylicola]|uniref:Two-component system response regulator n=1 Tax=Alkalihalobacillus trypoxylicola TaxID=519424 RepID=A0A161PKP1_9BACI|nr:response regulator transcription factor [Alkalihalobacillus trypoxylicola]KYG34836.1 two-component system response regulator [Alkalihalobacillus trypoxylicola]
MEKILIIEDEKPISQVLNAYLRKEGFHLKQVFDGGEAIEVFIDFQPDLVLLDVMLPNKDGWSILAEIRNQSSCPVIMLTALNDVNDKLAGLHGGADDYITKPFVAEEMVARVHAVLRRSNPSKHMESKKFGSLAIDYKSHRIWIKEQELTLTPKDLSLFLFLSKHPNQTFTREQLLDHVWGMDYEGSDRAVDLSIKRVRKELKNWPEKEGEILTLRGLGYQLRVNENNF